MEQVRKRLFLRHLYIKCIILPRQARDKHRENSKRGAVFSQVLAQAGDRENYRALEAWVRSNLRKELSGLVWTAEGNEWAIGE